MMIKNSKWFSIGCMLSLLVSIAGCRQGNKADNEFENLLTTQDTANVVALVDSFMTSVKNDSTQASYSMLRKISYTPHLSIEPLDSIDKSRAQMVFKLMPFNEYRIEYMKFYAEYKNEVLVSVIFVPATEDRQELSTSMYFKPVKHQGTWYLCLMDARHGDEPMIPIEKKDSMIRSYRGNAR